MYDIEWADETTGIWNCPFCRQKANQKTSHQVICYSRTCGCGATALGAPTWDFDEVIDDAINIFGIEREYLTAFDEDRSDGLMARGVEIRPGLIISDPGFPKKQVRLFWFRKQI